MHDKDIYNMNTKNTTQKTLNDLQRNIKYLTLYPQLFLIDNITSQRMDKEAGECWSL